MAQAEPLYCHPQAELLSVKSYFLTHPCRKQRANELWSAFDMHWLSTVLMLHKLCTSCSFFLGRHLQSQFTTVLERGWTRASIECEKSWRMSGMCSYKKCSPSIKSTSHLQITSEQVLMMPSGSFCIGVVLKWQWLYCSLLMRNCLLSVFINWLV